jgi:hypothetical protein
MRSLNGSACTSAGASKFKNMDTEIKTRAKQMSEELILQIEQAKKRHKVTNVKIAQVLGTSPQNVGEKLSTDKRRGASYYELASIIAAIETVSGKKFFAPRFCEVPQSNAQ